MIINELEFSTIFNTIGFNNLVENKYIDIRLMKCYITIV